MHKKLYPILKAAKAQKKKAFFNVDKRIIEGQVYRGKEIKIFLCTVKLWYMISQLL